ncbi:uncharacterized protein CTRU02_202286 [Colletotrichum truncatum]|uniref:Uncharacterized protein n=1 Tax=Colletotrichum truncatum TaxID=5467 RepID=A0ACC3ZJS7_COLTU|nr:uncharacterized protein CTRU02_01446 [Colletotrichum truncatum]KAF6799767.1 hypothetical protein CTRU02_01446 [Colletotrichum truncatum]
MARRGSGSEPPGCADSFSSSLKVRRRSSSSQTLPESQRGTQRLSFKTALRLIIPNGSSDTPGDSWDGSSTPKPAFECEYFGKQAPNISTSHIAPQSTPSSMATGRIANESPLTTRRRSIFDPPRSPKDGFE